MFVIFFVTFFFYSYLFFIHLIGTFFWGIALQKCSLLRRIVHLEIELSIHYNILFYAFTQKSSFRN